MSESELSPALVQSRESALRSRRDSMKLVQAALEQNPHDSLAHATRGFYLYGERHHRNRQELQTCVDNSRKYLTDGDTRALNYCNALTAASTGDVTSVVFHLEKQLLDDPSDITALKQCQSELFWLGEMQWSETISAAVSEHWDADHQYYSDYLAIRAFDLEETGQYMQAECAGRASVEINPSDVWGAHAVTHVMYMQGRSTEGAAWLDTLSDGGHWDGLGQMVLHLWWHRALFHVLNKDYAAALSVYDDYLRNFSIDMVASLPDLYLDLQNAGSLLMRLELTGMAVGNRWTALADICSERVDDMSNAFSCAHYAMVLAADERFDDAQKLIDHMQTSTAGEVGTSYSNAAIPAARAAVAHRKKDYKKVISILMPVRHRLVQMGGSHAQREVFLLLLADALQQESAGGLLKRLAGDLSAIGFSDKMANRIDGHGR